MIGKGGEQGEEIKREVAKGERMERRHICSTHLSAKRYNYLSQHIIHVLYQPRAPCLRLAALAPCKAHILTLAMTVYLRKENCPQGDGNRGREGGRVKEVKEGRTKTVVGEARGGRKREGGGHI